MINYGLIATLSIGFLAIAYSQPHEYSYPTGQEYGPVRTRVTRTTYDEVEPEYVRVVRRPETYSGETRTERYSTHEYPRQEVVYRGDELRDRPSVRGSNYVEHAVRSNREGFNEEVYSRRVEPHYQDDVSRPQHGRSVSSQTRLRSEMQPESGNRYQVQEEKFHLTDPHQHSDIEYRAGDSIRRLRERLADDFNRQPSLFSKQDMDNVLRGSDRLLMRFLNQREFNLEEAHELAFQVLNWRNKIQIDRLDGASVACDLFESGLIFEQKLTQTHTESARPVIWIRLGALGEAVHLIKSQTHFSARKAMSTNKEIAKASVLKIFDVARKSTSSKSHKSHSMQPADMSREYDSKSLINDGTLNLVLRSIAWWLNDWDLHHPLAKATLVLDFNGNKGAFESSSIGSFFIQLDDRFPDLFEQILAFRYEAPTSWTLREKVGILNRIFFSKVAAPEKTNQKIKFVNHAADMQNYISDQRLKGVNDIPEHVLKTCVNRSYPVPKACHAASQMPFYDRPATANPQAISLIKESLTRC